MGSEYFVLCVSDVLICARYTTCPPAAVKIGDLVTCKIAFVLVPMPKGGKYRWKMLNELKAVAVMDSSPTRVRHLFPPMVARTNFSTGGQHHSKHAGPTRRRSGSASSEASEPILCWYAWAGAEAEQAHVHRVRVKDVISQTECAIHRIKVTIMAKLCRIIVTTGNTCTTPNSTQHYSCVTISE